MAVLLMFKKEEKEKLVSVTRNPSNYGIHDIEMIYSAMALRFTREIIESHNIIDNDHIESVDACIAFSRDEHELYNYNLTHRAFEQGNSFNKPLTNAGANVIQFRLMVKSTDTIGGMASPSVVLATEVYKKLVEFAKTQ